MTFLAGIVIGGLLGIGFCVVVFAKMIWSYL